MINSISCHHQYGKPVTSENFLTNKCDFVKKLTLFAVKYIAVKIYFCLLIGSNVNLQFRFNEIQQKIIFPTETTP